MMSSEALAKEGYDRMSRGGCELRMVLLRQGFGGRASWRPFIHMIYTYILESLT
jgi:hypothetical protein